MANFRKSFNFRNGVQVDNDNFIVNSNGLVGIGTSVPTEFLDVRGTNTGAVSVQGLTTSTLLGIGETASFYGDVKIGSGIDIDSNSGVITATKFVGDASLLSGIFAISTTGWVAQGVGLHTFRSIGIGTTNPEYSLQIGFNPATSSGVAIESTGNVLISGVTTSNTFVGNLTGDVTGTATTANNLSDAANITAGTISDARLPNVITSDINSSGVSTFTTVNVDSTITMSGGIITAISFSGPISGTVTGNSDTASALQTARNITLAGAVESSATAFDGSTDITINTSIGNTFSINTSGTISASTLSADSTDSTNLSVGIGTFEDIRVDNTLSSADVVITSDVSSSVSLGKDVGAGNSSVELSYTPGAGRLDINNYDLGGVAINLHEGTGAGTTLGFSVKYDNAKQFEVFYDGKAAVNRGASPVTRNFEVGGDAFISNNIEIVGVLTAGQGTNKVTLGDGSPIPVPSTQNFNTVSGVSTFFNMIVQSDFRVGSSATIGQNLYVGGEVGIGTTNNNDFITGLSPLATQIFGNLYSDQGIVSGNILGITTDPNGVIREDPRTIPSELGSTVPYMSYGNFQVDSAASSIISETLLIVPKVGTPIVGFGSTNLGLAPTNYQGNKYLSRVGFNTYFPRSIFDVGTASTTMNSYFIPPSMPQSDLDVVRNLWQNTTGFGTELAKKVTPNGVPKGSLVYNETSEEIQVAINANTFGPMIPIGGIIMWSGSIASIPNGWRLCDGTNGTPDLRDKFVVGAGNAYSVNDTGGRIDAVLPLHGHGITDPGHDHNYDGQTTEVIVEGTSSGETVDSDVGITSTTSNVVTGITTTQQDGVALTGDENLPPYLALAYIMRTNA